MTAEDLHHALHFGKSILNAQVAVVGVNKKETVLNGTSTIPKIIQYHSFEFLALTWWCWGILELVRGKDGIIQMLPSCL